MPIFLPISCGSKRILIFFFGYWFNNSGIKSFESIFCSLIECIKYIDWFLFDLIFCWYNWCLVIFIKRSFSKTRFLLSRLLMVEIFDRLRKVFFNGWFLGHVLWIILLILTIRIIRYYKSLKTLTFSLFSPQFLDFWYNCFYLI